MKKLKGTRDLLAKDYNEIKIIFKKIRSALETYAYDEYKAPMLEYSSLYKNKTNKDLIEEQSFKIEDKDLIIRPELTASLTRMVLNSKENFRLPLRLYSIDTMMRNENPQLARLREFFQINFDIFYNDEELALIEILKITKKIFNEIDLKNYKVLINNKKWLINLNNYFDWMDFNELSKLLDKSLKQNIDWEAYSQKSLSDYVECDSWEDFILFLEKYNLTDLITEVKIAKKLYGDYSEYSSKIIRGLDYYTSFVFEIFAKDSKITRALGGGGIYDLGISLGKKSLKAVGVGLGEVPIMKVLKEQENYSLELEYDIFLFYQDQSDKFLLAKIQDQLAQNNKVFLLDKKVKISKAFDWVNQSINCKYLGIISENEKNGEFLTIKNLNTREQKKINFKDLNSFKIDF